MECATCGKKLVDREDVIFGQPIKVKFCPRCGKRAVVDAQEAEKLRRLAEATVEALPA